MKPLTWMRFWQQVLNGKDGEERRRGRQWSRGKRKGKEAERQGGRTSSILSIVSVRVAIAVMKRQDQSNFWSKGLI